MRNSGKLNILKLNIKKYTSNWTRELFKINYVLEKDQLRN